MSCTQSLSHITVFSLAVRLASASTKTNCCVLQQCSTRLALLVLCRHWRASHLLQHWQAWLHSNRSLRQRGAIVHRAHQGYIMRHAWRHWQRLASSKVLRMMLLPLITSVAWHTSCHLCLHLCEVPRLQQCAAASLQSACSHHHWWSA